MNSLGRGLESLIPEKSPEEIPDASISLEQEKTARPESLREPEAVLTSSSPISGQVTARSYQDNFTPRRGESVFWIEIEKIDNLNQWRSLYAANNNKGR